LDLIDGSVDEVISAASRIAQREGFAQAGDQVAITAGMPFGEPGTTSLLRIAEIAG
jgi:pyruvate kinase